jgi:hypothetical protein
VRRRVVSWATAATAVALSLTALPGLAHDGEAGHKHDDGKEVAPPAIDYAPPEEDKNDYSVPEGYDGDADKRDDKVRGERASDDASGQSASREPEPGAGERWRPKTLDDTTWRRSAYEKEERERKDEEGMEWLEPAHILFELRFGPYSPEVDEEFGGNGPYTEFFGSDPLFYFGLELDWLPLHIPYVGSIGAGFGWGFTEASGKAKDDAGADVESDTDLTIFPMHVSAVLRLDGPIRKWNVPIIPYAKVGLGFAVWEASGPGSEGGEGTSAGLHLALGGALALNTFDKEAALRMRESTGIRYASIYGEWMWANLDGLGSEEVLHVGTSTVIIGLSLDF